MAARSEMGHANGLGSKESSISSFPGMLSTAARPISPGPSPLNPIRFSSQSQASTVSQQRSATIGKTFESWVAERTRRSSTQSSHVKNTSSKGKERSLDSADSSSFGYDADPFVSTHYNPSTSFTSYESSSLPRSPITPSKKPRASLLLAASDALGFKFGKKRKSVKQIPQPVIMPEVIEISAPRRDEEGEERERLRDAAAQSIGIDPELLQGTQSREEDILEDEEEFISDDGGITDAKHAALDTLSADNSVYDTSVLSYNTASSPHHTGPLVRPYTHSLTHSRTNSGVQALSIPPFPALLSALKPLSQLSITLPKFYPPSSLLVYALSKQWKSRFMMFSSPITSGQTANVSYLHLFKSSNPEEKELERLEINENSVIFVAEEEVAGRGDVIKIGGVDVGAMRKDLNHEEAGRTLWLLQIPGVSDSQRWIGVIKNTIFSQRSMRAGLGVHAHTANGIEPRGDMDVMLSMRLQGIISSSSTQTKKTANPESNSRSNSHIGYGRPVSPPASRPTSSQQASRSPTIASKSSGHTVSTLKGMFGTRPRSSSRSTSIDQDRETSEDSFGAMGNNLLTMLRTNGTGDVSMTPTHPASVASSVPSLSSSIKKIIEATPSLASADQRLDLKIMKERQSPPKTDSPRSSLGLPVGSLSLQPPPRKKLWSIPSIITSQGDIPYIYQHSDGNRSVAGSFGIQTSTSADRSQSPASPALTVQSSIPEQRERAASLQSESTHTSTEISVLNRSSSSVKRWSRQANIPKQLTPPTGPPPSIPQSRAQTPQYSTTRPNSWLKGHPYAAERPPSRTSSQHSGLAPQNSASLSPTFWKRTSGSSVYSESGASTSNQRLPTPRTGTAKRQSMPPPRPAPTFAPPPAPSESQPLAGHDSLPAHKSLRNSVAQRALRLSLTAPKPPPSSDLPPRPDEPGYKSHRRSSSSGNNTSLYSIPGSPTPATPPFPPPTVPLPPPPPSNSSSRSSTIKQRLRILSTTSTPEPLPPPEAYAPQSPSIPSMIDAYSPPSTPIGERITTMQNDPSFLQLVTPVSPSIPKLPPRNPNRPSISECLPSSPEIMSLSPPPRRGSRHTSEKFQDRGESETQSSETHDENKLATLSQRGSVISLGIVTM